MLGTRLAMSTVDHPQTDGQSERLNRVIGDVLRGVCAESPKSWSSLLPVIEFTLNNAVHASTGFTHFYVNSLTHTAVRSRYHSVVLSLVGDSLLTSLLKSALPRCKNK